MYNIIADLHTHSIASTHAYSTINECLTQAKNIGLEALAITDHGTIMPGTPHPWYFNSLESIVPRYHDGVMFIPGMEANVIDFEGNTDLYSADGLNFVIASVHEIESVNLENPTIEKCTQMYLNLAKNEKINAIGHSGSPKFKYDYEKVIPVFKENHKLIEINNHTFKVRQGNIDNCREIALLCKKYEAPIIVSSDAHYHTYIGKFDSALKMLEEIDFPEHLIVNASMDRLQDYLRKYTSFKG